MPRLFVALWPPHRLMQDLARIPRPEVPAQRWTTPEQWHVTLAFLGSPDAAMLPDVEAALGSRLSRCPEPVVATAGAKPEPLSRMLLVLPVNGLDILASEVREAVGGWESPDAQRRPFRGHVTLARARRGLPLPVASGPGTPDLGSSWVVDEVTLVASVTLPEGARYEVVGRWSLPGSGRHL